MNSLNIVLIINSFLLILFILNQNETNKELTTTTNSSSTSNPLEKFTWGCLFLQFVFLLIKTKTTDF
jgi:preprotein translocase subunit SecG